MEQIQPYLLGWLVPTVLSGALGYVVGLLRKAKEERRRIEQERKADKDMAEKTLLMVCRLAIYDEHFSADEKVDAYRTYRDHGGNHQTKKYMDALLGEDADGYLARHE